MQTSKRSIYDLGILRRAYEKITDILEISIRKRMSRILKLIVCADKRASHVYKDNATSSTNRSYTTLLSPIPTHTERIYKDIYLENALA